MRTGKPYDLYTLDIKRSDRVLEVGSGHNPTFRSNVIVEKFLDNNYDRCGDVKVYPHQTLVHADGENLPFQDKEFDYVICNQVLEHVDNPEKFIRELTRVAYRGYIETPSLIGEFLFPKESHKWVILDIDNKLVFFEKIHMPSNYANDYGELFLNYLAYQSLPYKLLWLNSDGDMMQNRYEWKDDVSCVINPEDDYYRAFFLRKWTPEMVRKLFPPRSIATELGSCCKTLSYFIRQKVRNRFQKHQPLTLNQYNELHKRVMW